MRLVLITARRVNLVFSKVRTKVPHARIARKVSTVLEEIPVQYLAQLDTSVQKALEILKVIV